MSRRNIFDYNKIKQYDSLIKYYEKELFTDESYIEGAGMGVFSNIDLPRNIIIAEYRGDRYIGDVYLSEEDMKYSFITYNGITIVPYKNTIARYINDTIDLPKSIQEGELIYTGFEHNVDWLIAEDKYEKNPLYKEHVFIVTTQFIEQGDELFINYDIPYWQAVIFKQNEELDETDD